MHIARFFYESVKKITPPTTIHCTLHVFLTNLLKKLPPSPLYVAHCTFIYESVKKIYPPHHYTLHIARFFTNLLKKFTPPTTIHCTLHVFLLHIARFFTNLLKKLPPPPLYVAHCTFFYESVKNLHPEYSLLYDSHCAISGGGFTNPLKIYTLNIHHYNYDSHCTLSVFFFNESVKNLPPEYSPL